MLTCFVHGFFSGLFESLCLGHMVCASPEMSWFYSEVGRRRLVEYCFVCRLISRAMLASRPACSLYRIGVCVG